jgi:hypothetical protein
MDVTNGVESERTHAKPVTLNPAPSLAAQRAARTQPKAEALGADALGLTPFNSRKRPEWAQEPLIPNVPFIEFNLMTTQEHSELILECDPLVVLGLAPNILPHIFNGRLADRKRTITTLPVELSEARALPTQPVIGTLLEFSNDFAERDGAPQENERVGMIRLGIDLNWSTPNPLRVPPMYA